MRAHVRAGVLYLFLYLYTEICEIVPRLGITGGRPPRRFVYGGMGYASQSNIYGPLDDVWTLDMASYSWVPAAAPPSPLSSHTAVAAPGAATPAWWVFGGTTAQGPSRRLLVLDVASSKWTVAFAWDLASGPANVMFATIAAINGSACVVFGGATMTAAGGIASVSGDVWAFNFEAAAWLRLPRLGSPYLGVFGGAGGVLKYPDGTTRLLLWAGRTAASRQPLTNVSVCTLEQVGGGLALLCAPQVSVGRGVFLAATALAGNQLFVFGGNTGASSATSGFSVLSPEPGAGLVSLVALRNDGAEPWQPRSGASLVRLAEDLVLFGGMDSQSGRFYNDMWLIHAAGNVPERYYQQFQTDNSPPPARAFHACACAAARAPDGRSVSFCEPARLRAWCSCAALRAAAGALTDDLRMYCFGGVANAAFQPLDDLWFFTFCRVASGAVCANTPRIWSWTQTVPGGSSMRPRYGAPPGPRPRETCAHCCGGVFPVLCERRPRILSRVH